MYRIGKEVIPPTSLWATEEGDGSDHDRRSLHKEPLMAKTKTDGAASKKTECPLTRKEFKDNAKALLIKVIYDGQEQSVALGAKEFSTGSFGWGAGGDKITLMVGGVPVKVQAGLNLTVVNSKDAQ